MISLVVLWQIFHYDIKQIHVRVIDYIKFTYLIKMSNCRCRLHIGDYDDKICRYAKCSLFRLCKFHNSSPYTYQFRIQSSFLCLCNVWVRRELVVFFKYDNILVNFIIVIMVFVFFYNFLYFFIFYHFIKIHFFIFYFCM